MRMESVVVEQIDFERLLLLLVVVMVVVMVVVDEWIETWRERDNVKMI
jgi:hypothetical protein